MTKQKHFVIAVIVMLFCNHMQAQNQITIGPSVLWNVAFWEGALYTTFGGQAAYEIPVLERHSLNIAATAHLGKHLNYFDNSITETDFLIGLQPEYRFHLNERYEGNYLGIGCDIKHLTAKNYFSPTPGDPEPTFVAWELNFGLSFGGYYHTSLVKAINPFVYVGFNPFDVNEYGLSARFGFNVVL